MCYINILKMKKSIKNITIILAFLLSISIIPVCIVSCSNDEINNNNFAYNNISKDIFLQNNKQLNWNNLISNQNETAINNWSNYFNNEIKNNVNFKNVISSDLNQFELNINHILNLSSNWFYGFMFNHTLIKFSQQGTNFSGINNLKWAAKPISTITDFQYQIINKKINLSYVITTSYDVAATNDIKFWSINENEVVNNFVTIKRKVIVQNATIAPCLVNYPYNFLNYSNDVFYAYGGFYINFAESLRFLNPTITINKQINKNQTFLIYFDDNFVKNYLQNPKLINSSSAVGNKIDFMNPTSKTFSYSIFNEGYDFVNNKNNHLDEIRSWLNNYHNPLIWTKTVNLIPNLSLFNFVYQTQPMIFLDCYNHCRFYGTYSNLQYQDAYNEYKLNQLSNVNLSNLNYIKRKDNYEKNNFFN